MARDRPGLAPQLVGHVAVLRRYLDADRSAGILILAVLSPDVQGNKEFFRDLTIRARMGEIKKRKVNKR